MQRSVGSTTRSMGLNGVSSKEYLIPMALAWKLLTLIALMLMPFGMTAAPAAASHDHSASMAMGHCPDQLPDRHPATGLHECAMACSAALPAADMRQDDSVLIGHVPTVAYVVHQLHGLHPETATPPPKLS